MRTANAYTYLMDDGSYHTVCTENTPENGALFVQNKTGLKVKSVVYYHAIQYQFIDSKRIMRRGKPIGPRKSAESRPRRKL